MLPGIHVALWCRGVSHSKATGARLPAGIAPAWAHVLPARQVWMLGGLVTPHCHPWQAPRGVGTHWGTWAGVLAEPWQQAGGFAALPYKGLCLVPAWRGCGEPPCHGWGEWHLGTVGVR